MAKKLLILALALFMIVPMIASCGKINDTSGSGDQTVAQVATTPESAAIDEYLSDLAIEHGSKTNGKTFTWVGVGVTENEEEVGDLEQDALYYRQRDLEEIFGIEWVTAKVETVEGGPHPTFEAIRQDVMSGNKAYNVAGGTTEAVARPLFVQGCLSDVSSYSVLDLEQEWWTASLRDTYQIGGATYFLTGNIVSSYFYDSYCVMFNKQVAEDYDLPDMYELVKNNEWTFDKFFELSEKVPANTNGSGAYRFNTVDGTVLMYACDIPITQFDEQGMPYVATELSKELSDIADRFSSIFGDETLTALTARSESTMEKFGYESYSEMFADNQLLFFFGTTGDAAWLRTEETNFGILPVPKGSTAQEEYVSYIESWGAYHVVVPKTTTDSDVTDVILEAMGALSMKYLKPAMYDNILKSRATHDTESQEMIDIILAGKKYDLVNMLADDDSFVAMLEDAVSVSSEGFASKYKMQAKILNKKIESKLIAIKNGTY